MAAAGTKSALSSTAEGRGGLAHGLMLLTTLLWAGSTVAGKVALTGFNALALAQLRMGVAAMLYLLLYVAWRGVPTLRLTTRQWLTVGFMAFTGMTLNQICYIGGLARTSVTHTGLIQAIGPAMVLLLSASMRREALTSRKILGLTISFVGIALVLIETPAQGTGANWVGDVMLIAAVGFFAYYTIVMKRVADCYDPLTLNGLVFGLGAILLIPFCGTSVADVRWGQISVHAWWGLVYMVLFGSLVAYLMYAFALETLSASKVAAFAYLQPAMVVLMGVWLLGEAVSVLVVFGGVFILLGVYLTERAGGEPTSIQPLVNGRM